MAATDVTGLRVAVVCPYSVDVPGGVQGQVAGLAEQLRRRGADVVVFAPGGRTEPAAGIVSLGPAQAFRDNGSVTRTVIAPWRLAAFARRLRAGFDIVHVHEPMLPPGLAALAATRAPVVATFHMAAPDARWYRAFLPVVRAARARIDAAIAVSPAARDVVSSVLPGAYRVIPNGIDAAAAPAHGPAADGNVPRVLFVGRPDPRKGLPVLLQAFSRLRGRARLDLAGPAAIASGVSGVHAHGPVSDARLRELLSAADVVAVPSLRAESFGVVVLEAMAAGAAVVATDLEAHMRLVPGECGLLVPAGDADAMAAALDELIAAPGRARRMGAAGRRHARRYDWSAVLPAVVDAYAAADRHRRAATMSRC